MKGVQTLDTQKTERSTVESETSKANCIYVTPPALQRDNAEAVANCRDNHGRPWDQRQGDYSKDYRARDKYGDHSQMNGGKTYKRGDIYNE